MANGGTVAVSPALPDDEQEGAVGHQIRGCCIMFMGEYSHSIDTKGRLIIPSKFRELLGEEFVLTKGLDGCLSIYPMD